jgi:uncharacterized protein involved in copper resistance
VRARYLASLVIVLALLGPAATPVSALAPWFKEAAEQNAKEGAERAAAREALERAESEAATKAADEAAEHKATEERQQREVVERQHIQETQQSEEAERQPTKAPAAQCVVPSLKGDSLNSARKALSRAHCRLGKVTVPHRSQGRLIVTSQGIKHELKRPNDTAVAVTLAAATHSHA